LRRVISSLDELRGQLPGAVDRCLSHFPGVDRAIEGYEGLIAAQECLPDNEKRDAYAADYSALARLWEALSPDDCLQPYIDDYRWLTQVYESVKPPSGYGKLLWYALGAKTIKLIHENIHVEAVRDDLDTLVMDADVLADETLNFSGLIFTLTLKYLNFWELLFKHSVFKRRIVILMRYT
jgi:type I restriction enzyme R subunit